MDERVANRPFSIAIKKIDGTGPNKSSRVLESVVLLKSINRVRMPRRYSYDEEEARAYNNYYEHLYSECRCHTYDDETSETLCAYCELETERTATKVAAAAAEKARLLAQPFGAEIIAVKEQLQKFQVTWSEATQIEAIRNLFTVLLGFDKFLAAKPTLRNMAMKKANEFRGHAVAGPMLKELLDNFDSLIRRLPEVEGYTAE